MSNAVALRTPGLGVGGCGMEEWEGGETERGRRMSHLAVIAPLKGWWGAERCTKTPDTLPAFSVAYREISCSAFLS